MTRQDHLLLCLSEECSEVIHRVSKALRFSLEEIQRDQPFTNAERISDELNDLIEIKLMLEEERIIPRMLPVRNKRERFEKYLIHSKNNNRVSPAH